MALGSCYPGFKKVFQSFCFDPWLYLKYMFFERPVPMIFGDNKNCFFSILYNAQRRKCLMPGLLLLKGKRVCNLQKDQWTA